MFGSTLRTLLKVSFPIMFGVGQFLFWSFQEVIQGSFVAALLCPLWVDAGTIARFNGFSTCSVGSFSGGLVKGRLESRSSFCFRFCLAWVNSNSRLFKNSSNRFFFVASSFSLLVGVGAVVDMCAVARFNGLYAFLVDFSSSGLVKQRWKQLPNFVSASVWRL